jgi:chromosome segregation ATPase
MSEGRARLAIELIDFDPKFTKVMEFYFGSTFITEDSQVAKIISGGKSGRKPVNCVTLEGDKFST